MSADQTERFAPPRTVRFDDAELVRANHVSDRFYGRSETVHLSVSSVAPGGSFSIAGEPSGAAGMRILHVLSGTLVLANPRTGEVNRLSCGGVAWFASDVGARAFNYGGDELCILQITGQQACTTEEASTEDARYAEDAWLGRWPDAATEARAARTHFALDKNETLWRLEGTQHRVLIGLHVSVRQLTAGSLDLLPGQRSDPRSHGGDLAGYVVSGRLNVSIPDPSGNRRANRWLQVDAGDAFFLPRGSRYEYFNMTGDPVHAVFGVSPDYISGEN